MTAETKSFGEPCWPEGQERLVVTDVAAQDDNLLLAVHQSRAMKRLEVPIRGRRPGVGDGALAHQEDVLDVLVNGKSPEGTLIVPIIGAPGTGKSHLIRWLAAAIPDRDDLVIRHIPRERTSLPRVVEILFEGLEGPSFDELHRALAGSREQREKLDDVSQMDQVATRLIYRIAELIEHGLGVPWRHAKGLEPEVLDALCSPEVLPALLTDSVARAKLTRPGGAVHRLARDIIDGHGGPAGDDDDDELGFRAEDLKFASFRGFGQNAARALSNLKLPGYDHAAARILTDALDVAAGQVIGLGSVSLADLIEKCRAQFLLEGKELVLLFEDIAITRGLQLDLADALTTPAIRGGQQTLCGLRVALAVTATYWDEQVPETLSTRAHGWGAEMFSLDLEGHQALDSAPALIGRYLNAARIGMANLKATDARKLKSEVPNACDNCPLDAKDECHKAFGTSEDGHGLFPLTLRAATTLVRLADDQARPRVVLGDIVTPILQQRDALSNGTFPASEKIRGMVSRGIDSRRLDEISIDQTDALEKLDHATRQRAETLLRTWVGDGDEQVLETFGIPQSLLAAASTGRPKPARQPASGERASAARPPGADPDRGTLERWANGTVTLEVGLSRLLRKAVWEELRIGVRWGDFAMKRSLALPLLGITGPVQQHANLAVLISKTSARGALGVDVEPLVTLEPSAENARLLVAFYDRDTHRGYDFPGGAEAAARIRAFVTTAEAAIARRFAENVSSTEQIADQSQLLAFAAAPLVTELAIEGLPMFGSALRSASVDATVDQTRTREWTALRRLAASEHEEALTFIQTAVTRSQGEAARAPTALDVGRTGSRRITRDPLGLVNGPAAPAVRVRHDALQQAASAAIAAEAASIAETLAAMALHLGPDGRLALKSITDAVDAALAAARGGQVLRPPDRVQHLESIRLPRSTQATEVFETAGVAVRAAERGLSGESLVRLARVDTDALNAIRSYLDTAADILEQSSRAAREAIRARGGDAGADVTELDSSQVDELIAFCEGLQ